MCDPVTATAATEAAKSGAEAAAAASAGGEVLGSTAALDAAGTAALETAGTAAAAEAIPSAASSLAGAADAAANIGLDSAYAVPSSGFESAAAVPSAASGAVSQGAASLGDYGSANGFGAPGTSYTSVPGLNGATIAPTDAASLAQTTVPNALPSTGTWETALQAINKYAPTASLGLNALGQYRAQDAQKQFANIARPAQEVGNQLLAQYQTGTLSSSDQFAIQQWVQQQKAAIKQYYAKAGLSDSSMAVNALSQIDSQAETMRQQAIANELKQGLSALGIANPALTAGVQAGFKQDAQLAGNSAAFLQELAKQYGGTPSGTQ
jgi:hypothetical protein